MKMRPTEIASAMFVAALSLFGLIFLSGCDQRPYPDAAIGSAAASGAPPTPPLAGAPAPPPQTVAPSPPAAYAPAPSSPDRPRVVVAMAPIPNPGDPGSEGYYSVRNRQTHPKLALSPQPKAYAAAHADATSARRPAHASAPPKPGPRAYAKVSKPLAHAVKPPQKFPTPPDYAKAPTVPIHANTPAPLSAPPPPAYAKATTLSTTPKAYAGAVLALPEPVKPNPPAKDDKPAPPTAALAATPPRPAVYAQKGVAIPLLPAFLLIMPLIFAILDWMTIGSRSRATHPIGMGAFNERGQQMFMRPLEPQPTF